MLHCGSEFACKAQFFGERLERGVELWRCAGHDEVNWARTLLVNSRVYNDWWRSKFVAENHDDPVMWCSIKRPPSFPCNSLA